MFTPNGRPARILHARWRAKGGQKPIPSLLRCHTGGYATPQFRGLWRAAFPDREPLPTDPIATRDGRFTEEMLSIWL